MSPNRWFDLELGYDKYDAKFDPATWTIIHMGVMPEGYGADFELFHRQNLHELVHWIQYAGTTWGIFVSLCQMGESQRISRWFQDIPAGVRTRFFELHEADQPLLRIDSKTGQLTIHAPEVAAEQDEILGQYLGLFYAAHALRDVSIFAGSSIPPGKFLAQGMDIIEGFPWPIERLDYVPHGSDTHMEDVRTVSDIPAADVSVINILESAAVVAESMSIGHAFQGDLDSDEFHGSVEAAVRRLFGAEEEHYSRAFRIWVGFHPELQELGGDDPEMRNLGKAMLSFSLLADAALNPPLPPVYSFESPGESLWKDIDPASRFTALVHAGSRLPLPDSGIGSEEAVAWIIRLLDEANLPGIHRDLAAFADLEVELKYDHPDDFTYLESILLPRFLSLLRLRARDCLSVAAIGEFVQREKSAASDDAVDAYRNSFWVPVFLDREYKFSSHMPDEAAARYCESVNLRRLIRLSPMHKLTDMIAKPFHKAFSDMRPTPKEYEQFTLHNVTKQYGAWFEEDETDLNSAS